MFLNFESDKYEAPWHVPNLTRYRRRPLGTFRFRLQGYYPYVGITVRYYGSPALVDFLQLSDVSATC